MWVLTTRVVTLAGTCAVTAKKKNMEKNEPKKKKFEKNKKNVECFPDFFCFDIVPNCLGFVFFGGG